MDNEELYKQLQRLKEENGGMQILIDNYIRLTNKYSQALQEIREYCEEQNLKADYTACEVIRRIDEVIGAEE